MVHLLVRALHVVSTIRVLLGTADFVAVSSLSIRDGSVR
jgi:hypothetical protein